MNTKSELILFKEIQTETILECHLSLKSALGFG